MKKLLLFIFLLASVLAIGQNIQPKPNPARLVNDYANILTPDQKETLERKLVAYDDSTSTQIALITVASVGDYDPQTVALKYLRDWGVGGTKNNGVVILVTTESPRTIRIETGYGMEGVLPDVTAKQIIDYEITPNFKAGNFYRGFDEATNAIFKAAAGEYKAPEGYNKKNSKGRGGPAGFFILLFIVLAIAFMSRGGGGRGGGLMSRRGFSPFIIGSMLGGSGSNDSGWGGGGGFGGGGGGFGGFGGGSGGGGGASGSW